MTAPRQSPIVAESPGPCPQVIMRCPACNADNPDDAAACGGCQAALPPASPSRKVRRRAEAAEADSPRAEEYNRRVRAAFRLCLWSLVPVAGVVLGPAGALRAWRLIRQARHDPAFTALRGAQAAVLLGGLSGLFNGVGLGLMLLGLWLLG